MRCSIVILALSFALALPCHAKGGDDARRYDYFFLEALMQREKGNNDAAFDLFDYCVKINPAASEAYYYLAQYHNGLKNENKAMECLKRAVELAPDNDTYMETLARAYAAHGEMDESVAIFERLFAAHPDREDVLEILLEIYNGNGDNDNAIRTLDRLETLTGKSEELSRQKSRIYTRQGNGKAAIAEMKSLADKYPNDLNFMAGYGEALLSNDQPRKAYDVCRQILASDSSNVQALFVLRSYYELNGDTAEVKAITQRLLLNKQVPTVTKAYIIRQMISANEENGGDSTAILKTFDTLLSQPQPDADIALLCASYMNLKKMPVDSIEGVLDLVLKVAPDNAGARLQLVAYAWQRDDTQRVIDLCEEAHEYNPGEMAFYYYQGVAYYKREDNDNALAAFRKGVSIITAESDPSIVSDFYAVMGDLMYQKGMEAEAFAAYDSCLEWKDDNMGCLNNYAYYLSELNRELPKAEQMSYRTIKSDPKNATYLDTYAWILFLQERYSEAEIYIEQALQNDSDSSAVITEHAGDIHAMNGNIDRALSLWKDALAKNPDNSLLPRKIKQRKYLKK